MDEADIMLWCERQKTTCYLTSKFSQTPSQTLILGMDLKNDVLLLDEFFPNTAKSASSLTQKLLINTAVGSLALTVQVIEPLQLRDAPAVLVRIIDKVALADRRLNLRTQFSESAPPKIKLTVPLFGTLNGSVKDLSCSGLSMSHTGLSKPALRSSTGECQIELTSYLSLKLKVQIKSVRFNRKPYSHSVIRLMFCDLHEEQKDKLELFLSRHLVASGAQAA